MAHGRAPTGGLGGVEWGLQSGQEEFEPNDQAGAERARQGVAKQFERETGLLLTARALDALVTPALSHLDTITRELAEQKITAPFLESAVRTVLVNAGAITVEQGETAISFQMVRESLKKDCPYLCWA